MLVRKLGFLKRTVRGGATGVGAAAKRMILLHGVWSRNVRNLKRVLELSSQILGVDQDQINMKEVKKVIGQLDREKRINLCEWKAPQIAAVARNGGWLGLWDTALDLHGTAAH